MNLLNKLKALWSAFQASRRASKAIRRVIFAQKSNRVEKIHQKQTDARVENLLLSAENMKKTKFLQKQAQNELILDFDKNKKD